MSRINVGVPKTTGLHALWKQLDKAVQTSVTSPEQASVSTESLDTILSSRTPSAEVAQHLNNVCVHIEKAFETAASEAGVGLESIEQSLGFSGVKSKMTQAQKDAVVIMASALHDPVAYMKAATNCTVSAESDEVQVIGFSQNPDLGYSDKLEAGLEAFDARSVDNLRGINIMYAFSAAVQDEFGEGFFKTVTLSADNAGLEITLTRSMVMEEIRHATTGAFVEWRQRNLLDAISDTSLVLGNSTILYPKVTIGDAESEANFADKNLIAPKKIIATDGIVIDSAPLLPGKKIDLVGLGQNEKFNGQADQTDALDHKLNLGEVYFEIKTSDNKSSVISFNTIGLDRNGFFGNNVGRTRRVNLNFDTRDLIVTKDTLDIDGKPAAALAFLGQQNEGLSIRLASLFSGQADLQKGYIQVNGSDAEIDSLETLDADGRTVVVQDQTLINTVNSTIASVKFVGYTPVARYSNVNRRKIGLLVDSVTERARYIVPLSPPISVQRPITDTATQTDLAAPLNAQRLVNSINAVTKLLEVADTLRSVNATVAAARSSNPVTEIEGFARLVVRPVLWEETVDVASIITNTATAQRTNDMVAVITNKVRNAITNLYTESRYQPAADSLNGTRGDRPQVILGTDPTIASYLAVVGDWRTIIGFESRVVVSYDFRVRGKIFGSFVRPNVSDVDVMSFGTMAYVPELMTDARMPINGNLTDITQVQNRTLHVCTLPVLMVLNVQGFDKAAAGQVDFNVSIN